MQAVNYIHREFREFTQTTRFDYLAIGTERIAWRSITFFNQFMAAECSCDHASGTQARRLPRMVTKKAFQVLSKLLIEGHSHGNIVELCRANLQKSFGLSPENAFLNACAKSFDRPDSSMKLS
jgi:hypothetical protein